MALKDVSEYIKNMGKSVSYSMIDISKETAPAMAEFVDTNKDLFKDVYATLKDHKRLMEKTKSLITGSKVYEAAEVGLKAVKEDIRTGNFYNKARQEEFNLKYGGFGDMGDMDDVEFSMKDDEDDSFGSVSISEGDKYVGSTVESAVKASADLTSSTIARSAEYMGKVNKASTNAILVQNERLFGNLSNRVIAMHGGINDLYKLQATTFEATSKMNKEFYQNTTNLMRESNAMLKELLEMQRNMYKNEQAKAKEKVTYGDIVGASGMPDLKAYGKVIAKNFKGATGQFGDMLGMLGKDSNMLATFMASPLQFIPTFISKAIIPAAVASSMAELDKSLSGVFGTTIARFNKMAKNEDNQIASFIGKLFGINTSVKDGIDTSNYKKGAVPFDGITRKSIVEVIPGHLRRIEAILSGLGDERIYDYDKGKWTTASNIRSQYNAIGTQHRNNAFSDLRSHATRYTKKAGMTKDRRKSFDDDFENFLRQVYEDGGYLPSNLRKMKNNYSGVSDENFEIIRGILTTMSKSDLLGLAGRVMESRNKHNKAITDLEESGSALYNYLYDGSEMKHTNSSVRTKDGRVTGFGSAVNIVTVTDNLGNNVFFYLQNILRTLEWQKLNWGYTNGGGSRRRSGGFKDIKDSDWNALVNNSKIKYSSGSNQYYDERVDAGIAAGNLIDFKNADSDEALAEANAQLKAQGVLAGIKDEDERRRAYRAAGYGKLYTEQEDLNFGRYSHGKHGKGIVSRLREAGSLMDKFNVISEGIKDFAKSPASLLASVLDKANQSIFSFFYQDPLYDEEGNKIKGFMDLMASKMKSTFDKFNKFLDEKVLDPLKKKLGVDSFGDLADKFLGMFGLDKEGRGKIKDKLFGEGTFIGDFTKGFKEEISRITKEVANTTKTAVAETYGVGADAVFGTTFSTRGKAKDKERKKLASQRNTLISYMAQQADFKKRENFGTDAEYEAYVDEQMGNADILTAAIGWGRENRRARRASRESRTSANADGAPQRSGTHAHGARMITKAGLTMISPGEAIIPANMNPWNPDMDTVDIRAQLANEKKMKGNFLKGIGDKIGLNATGNDGSGTPLATSEPLGKQAAKTIAEGTSNLVNRILLGDDKQAKSFKDATDEIKNKVKDYLPTMAATGLIGGGVGLLTGIGGPILGAVAGAGLGLLQRSEKMQNWLFGEAIMDENGNDTGQRKGGVISQKTQEAVKKYLPDLKTFGIAGALGGLLTPLGPIGGLMIGSTLAYVKNNEKFANVLYGELGEDGERHGGIFNKKRVDAIKKAAPNILGGAAIGALLGPFGLVGNLAVGSAVGLASSTEGFKELIFGKEDKDGKRTGGIAGALHNGFVEPLKEFGKSIKDGFDDFVKKDILEPLAGAIEPIATELRDVTKKILMFVPNMFAKFFENKITGPLATWMEERIFNPLGKATKFLLSAPIKLAKTVVSAPFKAIGALGNTFRQKQIMQGRASYMTADERLNWRSQHKVRGALAGLTRRDSFRATDEAMAGMNLDQVTAARDALYTLRDGGKELTSKIAKTKKDIWSHINKYFNDNDKVLLINKGARKKILDAIAKEKFDVARHLIQTAKGKNGRPISDEEREELLGALETKLEEYNDLRNRQREYGSKSKGELTDIVRKAGLKNFKTKDAAKFIKYFDTEYDARKAAAGITDSNTDTSLTAGEGLDSQALENQTDRLVEELRTISDVLTLIATGEGDEGLTGKHLKKKNKTRDKYNAADKKETLKAEIETEKNLRKLKFTYRDKNQFYNADGSEKKELREAVSGNHDGVQFLLSKRHDGSDINVENLTNVLTIAKKDNKLFSRIQECSEYLDLTDKSIEVIKSLNDKEYAQFFQALYTGTDMLDDNGDLDKSYVKTIVSGGTNYKWKSEGNVKLTGFKKFAHDTGNALRGIGNAFKGSVNKTSNDYNNFFSKLGLVGAKSTSAVSPTQLAWLIDNKRHELDKIMKSKDPEGDLRKVVNKYADIIGTPTFVSEGESIIEGLDAETETRAFGKLGKLISDAKAKHAAKFKLIGGDTSDTKEGQLEGKRKKLENDRQNIIASGITSLTTLVMNWRERYDKDKEDEENGKKGFWGKLIRGILIGGKVIGAIGTTSLVAGLYKNFLHPIVANVFDNHVKPWWSEKALPALQESKFGKAIMRGMDYITGSGDFAESGGLRGTISTGFDWFLGRGDFKGKGIIDKVKNFTMDTIVPNMFTGLEWIIGDLAPKILSGLFGALPKLLGAVVKGIGNFFKLSVSDLFNKKVTTYSADDFEISYDGNIPSGSTVSKGGNSSVLSKWGLVRPASYKFDGNVSTSGLPSVSTSASTESGIATTSASPTGDTEYYVNEGGRTNGAAAGEALLRASLTKGGGLVKTFAKGGVGNKVLKNTVGKLGLAGKIVSGGVGGSATLLTGAASKGNSLIRKALDRVGMNSDRLLGSVAEESVETVAASGAKNVAEAAVEKGAETAAKKATKEGAEGLLAKITKLLTEKIGSLFKSKAVINATKDALKSAGKEATEKAAEKAAKEAGEKVLKKLIKEMGEGIAKAAGKALTKAASAVASAGVITIAFIVADFVAGMAKADSILGVTKASGGTTFLEKLLAGLINALTENLTFGLLPASTIVDVVVDVVAPALNIDTSKLKARRQAAIDEIEKWNREHPDDQYDSVEEYNKKDKWYTKAGKAIKNTAKKAWGTIKGWFGGGSKSDEKEVNKASSYASTVSGRGSTTSTRASGSYGMGSGNHFSQVDPKYASIAYNSSADTVKQTIKDSGCGPLAAAQVIQTYGSKADPVSAARYAISNGYKELNGGTIPTFFRDYLADNNINTELLTDIKSTVERIGSGRPVILMGTDTANSKSTPYGTSPHYVVATGFDSSGNIIIQNPESATPNSVYNAGDVLSRSSIAIGTNYSTTNFGKGTNGYKKVLSRIPRFGRAAQLANTTIMLYDASSVNSLDSDYIGKYVKKFESGTSGSKSIAYSSGNDWGLSCGSYQLTLRWGNCIHFLKKYFPDMVSQAGLYFNGTRKDFKSAEWPGAEYCSSPEEVEKVWLECVAFVGETKFARFEWEYIRDNYYIPACNKLSDIFNPNTHSRSMQECIWSWAVHRGTSGCNNEFRKAIAAAGINNPQKTSEAELLKACYDYRYNMNKTNRYSTNSGQERDTVKSLIGKKPIDFNGTSIASTAPKSSADAIKALMDSKAVAKFSTNMGSIFDEIGNAVKNTKLYQMYESIFGAAKEEEEVDDGYEKADTVKENINTPLAGPISDEYAEKVITEQIQAQMAKDGIKPINPSSPTAMLDMNNNLKNMGAITVPTATVLATSSSTGRSGGMRQGSGNRNTAVAAKGSGNAKINSAIKGIIKGGRGTGSTSTAIANLNKSVSRNTISTSGRSIPTISINRTTSSPSKQFANGTIDYSIILTAMIEILGTIADNTSAIQKIVDLLSEKLNLDTSSINTKTDSAKSIRAKLESKLQEMGERNMMDSVSKNSDMAALINAMSAIARG